MIRRLLALLLKPASAKATPTDFFRLPRTAMIWILLSLGLVILPHIGRMPYWLTLLCLACIGICILIYQGRMSQPGSKIKATIVFLVLFAIVAQYGRDIFSTDAIVGVLVVGVTLKLLELKRKRDVLMVIYLCYFTVMAEFIYSQSIPIAFYMCLCVLVITCALMSTTQTQEFQRPVRTLKLSAQVLLQSIPLMSLLFVLFPRIGPLWSVPLQTAAGVTGLSDQMAPGDIGNLTRSGDIAFRVEFKDEIPNYNELYWRGITLENFDGREWTRPRGRFRFNGFFQPLGPDRREVLGWFASIRYQGNAVGYNVIMEPTQQNWIYTLMVPKMADDRMWMRQDYQVGTVRPVSQRFSYDAISYLDHMVDEDMMRSVRINTLDISAPGNNASREFAARMYEQAGSDEAYVDAVLGYFRDQEFYYTLSPSLLGDNPVDEFLFTTREGFCEHYASAFTFLMRAAGIPSRVVLGYQGGEFNKYNGTLIVRQYDAHAWSEVWLEGRGWVRVDPTAAVAPGRIEYGSQFTFQEDEAFLDDEVFSMLKFRGTSALINDLILRLEMIDYAWNRFVLNYDQGMQFAIFSRLFERVSKAKILYTLLGLIVLFVGGAAFLVLRKPSEKPLAPANVQYLKFCRFLADNGISRLRGESPMHFRDRVTSAQPQWANAVSDITSRYMELAFQDVAAAEQESRLRQLKLAIRKLKVIN